MMKKLMMLLVVCLLLTTLAVSASALENYFSLGQTWDSDILAGGIYDMFAWPEGELDEYTYQWQVDTSIGRGSWHDLEDNANPYGYRGTKTNHLELVTAVGNGMIIGTGWEDIPFRCVVTDKKTGHSRATADMFMKIFTSDDLKDYMRQKEVALFPPNVNGAPTPTTTDDEIYYTTVECGKELEFSARIRSPQNDPLMARSEVKAELEIWITENGKTYKCANESTYIPCTIGKDAIVVQYKLHYQIGVTDMGYYDTKTVKITTTEPTADGWGFSNCDVNLTRGRSTTSGKLTGIPKGTYVKICGTYGDWYRISYDGYLGYVPTSAINAENNSPIIEHVDLKMAEPLAGNIPPTSITVNPSTCFATSVEWYDKTDSHFMEAGERFMKGHDYQLVVWVSAEPYYSFKLDANDNMLTTATLNGHRVCKTSRAYEQIIGKVIDIRYDYLNVQDTDTSHVCRPVFVEEVAPTCTTSGVKAHYRCSCGLRYKDAEGTEKAVLATWGVIPATGHTVSDWRLTQVYHYTVCVTCGEMLKQEDHYGGTLTCTEKARCVVCGTSYGQYEPDHRWGPGWDHKEAAGHAWVCADCKDHSTLEPHTPGSIATETTDQVCTQCGFVIEPAKGHQHDLQKVPAVSATCTDPGNIEYYVCVLCMHCFTDGKGENKISELTSVEIAPVGHIVSDQWSSNEAFHWRTCSVCGALLEETQMAHEMVLGKCDTCGYSGSAVEDDPKTTTLTEPVVEPPVEKKGIQWPVMVVFGLFCFGLSVTVVVLILRRKKK